MRLMWVWAVVGDVGEACVGEASVGVGVGTDMGVRGVGESGVVSVTVSVGDVGCWALA